MAQIKAVASYLYDCITAFIYPGMAYIKAVVLEHRTMGLNMYIMAFRFNNEKSTEFITGALLLVYPLFCHIKLPSWVQPKKEADSEAGIFSGSGIEEGAIWVSQA
ncbi:hypothetical protein CKAN_00112400 [Cinnamomum micranthum f. kanehirae]|uniref:Uncharacterized protein n=1 Tax=Cinnamomum micranthum f. kanehirae TaxID=337451 RepID=A0A3S3MFM9_9MAGN|nr:hypothetical protein CKAN_00112400 [Cinnamomum micranthum f. kanehirae]